MKTPNLETDRLSLKTFKTDDAQEVFCWQQARTSQRPPGVINKIQKYGNSMEKSEGKS